MDFVRSFITEEVLNRQYLGNSVLQWLAALILFCVVGLGFIVLKRLFIMRLRKWAEKTETTWDDFAISLLVRTKTTFIVFVAIWIASTVLTLTPRAARISKSIVIVVLLIQAGIWGREIIKYFLHRALRMRQSQGEPNPSLETTLGAVEFILRLGFYALIFLLILDNLGFNISALITGLGIGGIAVALAVQNVLGDLFASLSIVLDKPFVLGDVIQVGPDVGTVEKIGLKTTRISSLSGEQLIFSNAEILKSVVRNYKRMGQRRVVFSFGVTYSIPYEKLSQISTMVEKIIKAQPETKFDRTHFKKFGDSSLDFEVVYFVLNADYAVYVRTEEKINLELFKAFEQEGIEFAFPTRTMIIESIVEKS